MLLNLIAHFTFIDGTLSEARMLSTMTIFLTISSGLFILVTCPPQCFIVFLVWYVAVLLKRIMQDYETGHLFVVDFGASILTAVCLWYSLSETPEFVKCIIVFGLVLLMVVFEQDNAHGGGYSEGYGNVDGNRRSKGELNVEIESQDTMTDVDNMHIMDGSQGDECGVVSKDEVVVTDTHIEGTATTEDDAERTDGNAIDSDVEERDKGKGKHENRDVIDTREADVRSHDILKEDEKKSTYIETKNTAHTVHGGMGHNMNVTDSNVTAPLLSNISGQPSINVHMENVSNGQMLTDKASEQEMQSKDEAATDTYVEGQETEDSKPAQDVDDKGQQIKNNDDLCDDDAVDGTYNDVVDDEDDDGDGDEEDDEDDDGDGDDDDDDDDDEKDEDDEDEDEDDINKNDSKSRSRCRLKRVARDLKHTKDHMRGIENSLEEMKANSSGNRKENNENSWQNIKLAARQGNNEDFRRLVKDANVELKRVDENGNNLLNIACIGGNPDIVKELLVEYKFDIDSKGEKERNPVMVAASEGHWKVYKLLQDNGCSPMMHDVDGNTEIHLACEGGNLKIVADLFMLKKVHVNARNSYGRTPLMFASKNGKMEVVEYLADLEGCDLKAVDKDGDDSIKFADLGGYRDIVEFLQGKISKNSDKVRK